MPDGSVDYRQNLLERLRIRASETPALNAKNIRRDPVSPAGSPQANEEGIKLVSRHRIGYER